MAAGGSASHVAADLAAELAVPIPDGEMASALTPPVELLSSSVASLRTLLDRLHALWGANAEGRVLVVEQLAASAQAEEHAREAARSMLARRDASVQHAMELSQALATAEGRSSFAASVGGGSGTENP